MARDGELTTAELFGTAPQANRELTTAEVFGTPEKPDSGFKLRQPTPGYFERAAPPVPDESQAPVAPPRAQASPEPVPTPDPLAGVQPRSAPARIVPIGGLTDDDRALEPPAPEAPQTPARAAVDPAAQGRAQEALARLRSLRPQGQAENGPGMRSPSIEGQRYRQTLDQVLEEFGGAEGFKRALGGGVSHETPAQEAEPVAQASTSPGPRRPQRQLSTAEVFGTGPAPEPSSFTDDIVRAGKRGVVQLGQAVRGTGILADLSSLARESETARHFEEQVRRTEANLAERPDIPEDVKARQIQALRERAERAARRRDEIAALLPGKIKSIEDAQGRIAELPPSPSAQRLFEAKTFGEAFDAIAEDPFAVIAEIGVQSLPVMVPSLGAAFVGGAFAGPAGFAGGLGFGSGMTEVGLSLIGELQKHGANLDDPESVRRTFETHQDEIRRTIYARGLAIGVFDALSGAIVSKGILPAARAGASTSARIGREVAEAAVQTPVQGVLGATGELVAGATTHGIEPGEVVAEFAGEFAQAPIEVGTAAVTGARAGQRQPTEAEVRRGEMRKSLREALDGRQEPSVPQPGQEAEEAPAPPPDGSREAPIEAVSQDQVAEAGGRVEPEPSEAQKEAGNYRKGHVKVQGLDVTIENPRGSVRRGTDAGGKPWQVEMPADYGYVKRTEGADGDQVDVYIGPVPASQTVWIVDQIDAATGKFDEHKAMLGFSSVDEATAAYVAGFSDDKGAQRLGAITPVLIDDFKAWLKSGDTTKPLGDLAASQAERTRRAAMLDSATPPHPTSLEDAKTGRPFTQRLYRGYGRAVRDDPNVYTVPGAGPILGPALYYSTDPGQTARFGPQTDDRVVELSNPLVIDDDQQWRALTKEAGWEFPNPFRGDDPESVSKVRREAEALRKLIDSRGHDGVVIRLDPDSDATKTLTNVFGDDQVIDFGTAAQPVDSPLQGEAPAEATGGTAGQAAPPRAPQPAKKKRAAPKTGPLTLLEFLSRKGGIQDQTGELKAMDADLWHRDRPFRRRLMREQGLVPDMAREEAAQAGYIDNDSTLADFYELIDRELRGQPVFSEGDRSEVEQKEEARAAEKQRDEDRFYMEQEADRLGIVPQRVARLDDHALALAISQALAERSSRETWAEDADTIEEQIDRTAHDDIPGFGSEVGEVAPAAQSDRDRAQATESRPAETQAPAQRAEDAEDRAQAAPESRGARPTPEVAQGAVTPPAPSASTEQTDQGTQTVLPGAERIGDRALAERRMQGRKKPTAEQKPADEGLFDVSGRGQDELFAIASTSGPRRFGIPKEVGTPISSYTSDSEIKVHADYTAAKAGDQKAAERLVADLVKPQTVEQARAQFGSDVVYAPVIAREASGDNAIPWTLAAYYTEATGAEVTTEIVQASTAFHTGAKPLERILARPVFEGAVEPGKRYVLVDDVTVMGGTLAELANHIREGGGEVAGVVTLVNASRNGIFKPRPNHIRLLENRFGDEIRSLGIEPAALTGAEAAYLAGFKDVDQLRKAVANSQSDRRRRLRAKGLLQEGGEESLSAPASRKAEPSDQQRSLPDERRAEIVAAIRKAATTLVPDAKLKIVDELFGYIGDRRVEGKGSFRAAEQLITVALGVGDPQQTLRHEAIHALRSMGLFKPNEWAILARESKRVWRAEYNIDQAYRGLSEEQLTEEGIAEAFGQYRNGVTFNDPVTRVFDKIVRFLERLANALRGLGFQTVEDIFTDIETGATGRRMPGATTQAEATLLAAAWHGTPHEFDTFSTENIGTGEGAQAYGWGLYFAGKRQVAEYYRNTLSKQQKVLVRGVPNSQFTQNEWAQSAIKTIAEDMGVRGDSFANARSKASLDLFNRQRLADRDGDAAETKEIKAALDIIQGLEHGDITRAPGGSLLKVNLAPAEDEYLLWDKPLSEQSEKVKAAVETLFGSIKGRVTAVEYKHMRTPSYGALDSTGQSVYLTFSQWFGGDKAASQALAAAGIPGIKYLDGQSRNRALKDIKREFLAELPEDAEIDEVADLIGTGHFSPKYEAVIVALQNDDWLGFDFPSQAISAAYSGDLSNFDASLALVKAVSDSREDGTYNYVIFDERLVSIEEKFALVPGSRRNPLFGQSFNVPSPHVLDRFRDRNVSALARVGGAIEAATDPIRIKLQDKFIILKRIQRAIAKQRGLKRLPENIDAYMAEELYHGRTGQRLSEFQTQHVEPLIEDMDARKLDLANVEIYLYARHAKERNAQIAKINPDMPDGGSGMTDAEADQILADIRSSGKQADFDAIAARVDAINQARLNMLEAEGLIDPQQRLQWEQVYSKYVPLRGLDDADGSARPATGRGYDIRGQESKRALGRKSLAGDLLAYVFAQYEESLVRAEKNRVGRAFLKLVQSNPHPELWEVNQVQYTRRINPKTGLVEAIPDARAKLGDDDLAVKVGGKVHHITIHEPDLALAMKNLGAESANILIRTLSAVNRFLAAINTSFNPEFLVSNFARDIQTAAVNLQGFDIDKAARHTVRDVFKAMKGVYLGQQGDFSTPWAKHFKEMADAGGTVGFFSLLDIEGRRARIDRLIKEMKPGKAAAARRLINASYHLVQDLNMAVENATRLSAYVQARRAGWSKAQAASLAKNLTVNFNRRGQWAATSNAMYLFYNASVQGSVRVLQALKSRRVQAVVLAIIGGHAALEILNQMIAQAVQGDDGDNDWDKVSPWTKEHNIMLVNPGPLLGIEGGPVAFKLPMPYGYNAFAVAGQKIGEMVMGKSDPMTAAIQTALAAVNAFNPLGGEESILQLLSPTILDPVVEIAINQDFTGRPIMPEGLGFGPKKPDSQLYWSSTRGSVSQIVAEQLNSLTGGGEFRPGAIDISPETLDHWTAFLTGGVGTFVQRNVNLTTKLINGEEIALREIPFARRVLEGKNEFYTRIKYRELRDEARLTDSEVKALRKAGKGDEANAVRRERRADLRVMPMVKTAEKQLRNLRKRRDRIRAGDASASEKRKQVKEIEDRMDEIMQKVIDRHRAFRRESDSEE